MAIHDLQSSTNYLLIHLSDGRMRWAGHVAHMAERRGVYRFLVRKPEGKRQLGRPRRRWEDNIKVEIY
jgi:hypothetical protein